jgi:hypothetical protein
MRSTRRVRSNQQCMRSAQQGAPNLRVMRSAPSALKSRSAQKARVTTRDVMKGNRVIVQMTVPTEMNDSPR